MQWKWPLCKGLYSVKSDIKIQSEVLSEILLSIFKSFKNNFISLLRIFETSDIIRNIKFKLKKSYDLKIRKINNKLKDLEIKHGFSFKKL